MERILFDSLKDKNPIGAVSINSPVFLRVRVNEKEQALSLRMILRFIDDADGKEFCFEKTGNENGYDLFELTFTVDTEGIYYYRFEIDTNDGIRFVGRDDLQRAVIRDFLPEWQLTVSKQGYKVPNVRKNNITYQIFVDRFNVGKQIPFTKKGVEKRWDEPITTVDSDGVYRANDFYKGNLSGITEKLDYIKELGVKNIYLSPIFKSSSNHRYDTGDYMEIDELLGDEKDFETLIAEAKKRGIGVMLDGVFNHTGSDSLYFNKNGSYDSVGAYNDKSSKYYDWYTFTSYPDEYACWWGCTVVPTVTNKKSPSFQHLIFDEVIDKWTKKGISGWRLDVADELPEFFVDKIREKVKSINKNAVVIGEVWEDATTKVSYSTRRPYLLGNQLDGVMNYPVKNAIIAYLLTGNKQEFWQVVSSIINNYPTMSLETSLTMLDSHDTFRIINVLSKVDVSNISKQERQAYKFSKEEYDHAVKLLRLGVVLQYTLIGSPTVFYGDEQGLTGWDDPLSRVPFVENNKDLHEFYVKMGKIHNSNSAIKGEFIADYDSEMIVYDRVKNGKIKVMVNNSGKDVKYLLKEDYKDLFTGKKYKTGDEITVDNEDFALLKEVKKR